MIHGCLMHSARLRFETGDLILRVGGWGGGEGGFRIAFEVFAFHISVHHLYVG